MKKLARTGLLIVASLGVLSACAYGSEDSSGDDGNSSGETVEDSGEEAEEGSGGQSGGKVSIPIVADPTFNPWHPNAYAESNVVNRVLFSGLTKPGEDLVPSPSLAESWETSEDELEWTFQVREDVLWHDGETFDSEDVSYTFNEIVLNEELGANGASFFGDVEEVVADDEFTVTFKLSNPVAALPAYLGFNSEILPEHIFNGEDPWDLSSFNKDNAVGTGPFKMSTYTSGQSVVLERNEDYFGDTALLDEVEYKVLADSNTHVAQILSGELSIFSLEDTASIERIEQQDGVDVYPRETTQFYWLSLNQEHEKYQEPLVRQAITHAINRENIIDTVLQGYGTIADHGISPALEEYYRDDVETLAYDPDEASLL
ncbi:oligopeptide ABC transporter, periplasmic oligopeptide-binding protein OppA [Geomicrobium sp. JCM 19037]|uniref:ABC transporter substrate-binding protein n=1 Tax=Geomicrobium sp. JCM 19037 TaxID=1460634 RepID=UPI00045F32C9|nr:ABC transporter substrate-binding protein [Geomicrobium sp. JCM 19037]GAK06176.1 oligopeptide ABC transporter, periplasmic oligopeptide-binding protein OppA [Geomicrobium sp. JCM 19037]